MKKTKKIIKEALKHPELHTEGELAYFELYKARRKAMKAERKANKQEEENG